jgi:hypothetical protein
MHVADCTTVASRRYAQQFVLTCYTLTIVVLDLRIQQLQVGKNNLRDCHHLSPTPVAQLLVVSCRLDFHQRVRFRLYALLRFFFPFFFAELSCIDTLLE